MSSIRLNAAAIAANTLPLAPPDPGVFETLERLAEQPLVVTRRDVLKAAGMAAFVATGALSLTSLDPIESVSGARARTAWLRAGRHRTIIDPSLFGGAPSLEVSTNGDWHAVLRDALFPGLSLPAGMDLRVVGAGFSSRLLIDHQFGGFRAEVPLSAWLAGEVAARSGVWLRDAVVNLGDGMFLTLNGMAEATLRPDWSMRLQGTGIGTLAAFGTRLVADVVTISLPAVDAPSLLSRRVARRSLVSLERGDHVWQIAPPESAASGTLALSENAFDLITLEAAETRSGTAYHAAVAHGDARASWLPKASLSECATALPLENVRYARLLGGEDGFHLAADYPAQPVWMHLATKALLLGGAQWAVPFELSGSGGVARAVARPAVRGVTAPIKGAITEPLVFPPDSRQTVEFGDGKVSARATIGPIGDLPFDFIDITPIPLPFGTSLRLMRPDDLISLRFALFNLTLVTDGSGGRMLKRSNRQQPAYIAVYFPAQHVLEQAFADPDELGTLKAPVKSLLADESRLAFLVPNSRADAGIPYTLEGLLDWSGFQHSVVPAGQKSKTADDLMRVGIRPTRNLMTEPSAGSSVSDTPPQTSLELPWGLYLSPHEKEWWAHRSATVTKNGRTELWHTRLRGELTRINIGIQAQAITVPGLDDIGVPPVGSLPGALVEAAPILRAVWARHWDARMTAQNPDPPSPANTLFRNHFSLSALPPKDPGGIKDRWAIVEMTGRYHDNPINVNRLALTSLGAWLDSMSNWDVVKLTTDHGGIIGNSVEQWDHRTTMGRDAYVKVVRAGYLFPFGHRASEITITERKVHAATGLAFLSQKVFIIVREPVKSYSQEADPIKRRLPFSRVEMKTLSTPQIRARLFSGLTADKAFWVQSVATNTDFPFQVETTDWDGKTQKFEMPMIFVRLNYALHNSIVNNVEATAPSIFLPGGGAYQGGVLTRCATAMRAVSVPLSGQRVAYAKRSAGDANAEQARVMPTNWIKFNAALVNPTVFGQIRFYPVKYQANVQLDAVEELTNQSAGTTIQIATIYRDNGYSGPNSAGKVFAEIVSAPTVGFPAELSGALATPIPKFTGISATKGTFGGDLAQVGAGQFSPGQFFDALDAKLLGGITLKDVLETVLDLGKMPEFVRVTEGNELVVRYVWETPVTKEFTLFVPNKSKCKLKLKAEVRKSLTDAAAVPTYLVRGELNDFELNLVKSFGFEAIIMKFDLLSFESKNGGAPNVDPKIRDVQFGDDLSYLSELAKYLGALGGAGASALAVPGESGLVRAKETVLEAGPLKVDVDASGILASLTIQLPDISIGVFSLKNMSIYAGLRLPFTGEPVELDFGFCSREAPFELLVMGFGGGGYVLMTFDTEGIKMVEISLEFGAGTSLDIGVASGSIELKGGLRVKYDRVEGLELTVFIRLHGELSILGLIRLSLTFSLELTYRTTKGGAGDELTGTATLTIEIEIVFFTIPVEMSVTKTLAGKDPRFKDLMPVQDDWDEYCEAFAPAKLGA